VVRPQYPGLQLATLTRQCGFAMLRVMARLVHSPAAHDCGGIIIG
jgi:hypothetical protein